MCTCNGRNRSITKDLGRCVHEHIGIKVTNYTGIWLSVRIGVSIYRDMGYCMDIITCTRYMEKYIMQ